jgi:RHS repeat-associated protein
MGGTSRPISYQYDAGGRRSRITHPDGNFIAYEYDAASRPTTIVENGNVQLVRFAHDAPGRRTATAFNGASTSYGYDPVSRLSSLFHDLDGASGDQILGFGYNPASQIVERSGTNDAYRSNTAYPVSRSYAVNGLNQYTAAGPATFAYDGNGNLISDGSSSFVYDSENRLVSASGAASASLVYDPLGRLFQTSGGSAGVTQFLHDGDALIGEYDAAGAMIRRYVHGTAEGVDDPLIWYDHITAGTRRGLLADHQGSVIAVSTLVGHPLAINAYDSWGIPNAGNQGRFGHTGQAWIPELGMWHYKARIYSPTLGRFLQTDPVGYRGGINLYAYVGNDPINQTDSTGLATDEEIRRVRNTLNTLQAAIRRDIKAAEEPPVGSRIRAASDTARIAILRGQLRELRGLDPAALADMRVNAPDAAVGSGLASVMRGAEAEAVYTASGPDGSVTFGRAPQTSQTSDSGRANTSTANLRAIGHPHEPGAGREYPGVGDPGNVLTLGVPNIYAVNGNANAIGWDGSRFTMSSVQGTMPSYNSAPDWIRNTFAPW